MSEAHWSFLHSDSIWPLAHVVLAYHAYMYGRSWKAVLLSYYIFKTLQIFFFALLGWDYKWLFLDILSDPNKNGNYFENNYSDYFNPKADSEENCAFDVNDFLLGGTIQTLMGVFLAWTHVYVLLRKESVKSSFHPITFWKSKNNPKDPTEIALGVMKNYKQNFNFGLRYGIWPLYLMFGVERKKYRIWFEKNRYWVTGFWNFDDNSASDFFVEFQGFVGPCNPLRTAEVAWRFRKRFWKRWLQLTLLGTPSLLFYGLNDGQALRSGSVIYGFITCALLLYYKNVNQKNHVISVALKNANFIDMQRKDFFLKRNDSTLSDDMVRFDQKLKLSMVFNSCEVVYTVWSSTCVVIIALQSVSVASSFYKALIAVGTICVSSFFMKFLTNYWILKNT